MKAQNSRYYTMTPKFHRSKSLTQRLQAPPRLELSEAEKREVPRWLLRKVALRHEAETYAQQVRARKAHEREMCDKAVHDREKREGANHHRNTHERSRRSGHHQTKPRRDRDDYLDLPYPEYPGQARPSGRSGLHNHENNDDYQPRHEVRPSRRPHHHHDDEDDLASQFARLRGPRQTSQTHGRPVHPAQRDNNSKRPAAKSGSAAAPSKHCPEPYSHDRPAHPAQRDNNTKRPATKLGSAASPSNHRPEPSQRGKPPTKASQTPRSRQKEEPSQRGKPSQQGISKIQAGQIPRPEQKKPAGPAWDNHGADSSHPW